MANEVFHTLEGVFACSLPSRMFGTYSGHRIIGVGRVRNSAIYDRVYRTVMSFRRRLDGPMLTCAWSVLRTLLCPTVRRDSQRAVRRASNVMSFPSGLSLYGMPLVFSAISEILRHAHEILHVVIFQCSAARIYLTTI